MLYCRFRLYNLKKSHLNLVSARALYTQHTYSNGQSIPEFIRHHDERYHNFAEAGSEWTDAEQILQLQAALPPTYDSYTEWYQYRQEQGTATSYDNFRKKVTDKYERLQSTGLPRDTSQLNIASNRKNGNTGPTTTRSNGQKSGTTLGPVVTKTNDRLTCSICHKSGHSAAYCRRAPTYCRYHKTTGHSSEACRNRPSPFERQQHCNHAT